MNIIDALVVTFALDSKGFAKGEREVNEATERLSERNKRAFTDMESRSVGLAESLKNVRNEVVGLGLAFLGASTITGLIANMAHGAATADRMGQTMGMAAKQVWAWRMAMKSVGGDAGEGDAALQTIQNAKMGWQMRGDTGNNVAYSRLGIGANDLMHSSAGDILQKLSSMQGKMDPQMYASLLQQIGLPASTIYFLQQGKDSVDKLLKQYESDAKGQEELAKQTEHLQAALATLEATIAEHLVPPLVKIADFLTMLLGGQREKTPDRPGDVHLAPSWMPQWAQDLLTIHSGGGKGGSSGGGIIPEAHADTVKGFAPISSTRNGSRADRNNNPGNIKDGRFARSMPGYVGSDGTFARFATPSHGEAAMSKLLSGYLGRGWDTIAAIISRWAPSSENNTASYISAVERETHLSRYQHLTRANLALVQRSITRHERGGSGVHIGHMTINSRATDAHGVARDIHGALRRHAVAQADRGVAP